MDNAINTKIFCIGYPRTGTTSLAEAIANLGFTSWHYDEPYHDEVIDILRTKKLDYDFLDKFDSFADYPIFCVYKELDQKYPGSKFILVTRDKYTWYDSMAWMLHCAEKDHPEKNEHNRFMWKGLNADMIADHTADVLNYFHDHMDPLRLRPYDLYVCDIKDLNYPSLAAFLKVRSLNGKFPHLNRR